MLPFSTFSVQLGVNVCPSRRVAAGVSGALLSPNYPIASYPNTLDCTLTLSGINENSLLLFHLKDLNLQPHFIYGCYDYLRISGAASSTTICREPSRKTFVMRPTRDGEIMVRLFTDSYWNDRGFNITYAGMADKLGTNVPGSPAFNSGWNMIHVNQSQINLYMYYFLLDLHGFAAITPAPVCGRVTARADFSGYVSSHADFPAAQGLRNMNCTMEIQGFGPNAAVLLTVISFTADDAEDQLSVTDGDDMMKANSRRQVSANYNGSLRFFYSTGGSQTQRGFLLAYKGGHYQSWRAFLQLERAHTVQSRAVIRIRIDNLCSF